MLKNIIKEKKKHGFTLLEVIIAMGIIMIIAATFYDVEYAAIRNSKNSKEQLEGLILAQGYIEKIKATKDINILKPSSNDYILNLYTTTELSDGNNKLVDLVVRVNLKRSPSIVVVELGTKIYIKQ